MTSFDKPQFIYYKGSIHMKSGGQILQLLDL